MDLCKRLPALLAALLLALALSGCSVDEMREKASDIIIDMATRFGFIEEGNDEDTVERREANPGGSVVFPEDFEYGDTTLSSLLRDGTLYVSFKSMRNRSTDYFVATGSSVTITAYATSTNAEAETPPLYKTALWMLSEDMTHTSYVDGSTVYFSAAGENNCYSCTVSGLQPGRRYKVNISYDTGTYYMTGGLTVSDVSDEDLLSIDNSEDS